MNNEKVVCNKFTLAVTQQLALPEDTKLMNDLVCHSNSEEKIRNRKGFSKRNN